MDEETVQDPGFTGALVLSRRRTVGVTVDLRCETLLATLGRFMSLSPSE